MWLATPRQARERQNCTWRGISCGSKQRYVYKTVLFKDLGSYPEHEGDGLGLDGSVCLVNYPEYEKENFHYEAGPAVRWDEAPDAPIYASA